MSENVYWRGKPNSIRLSPLPFLLRSIFAFIFYFTYDEFFIGFFPVAYMPSHLTLISLLILFVLVPTLFAVVRARKTKEAMEYAITSAGIYKRVGHSVELIHAASIDRVELTNLFGSGKDILVYYGMPIQMLRMESVDSAKDIQRLIYHIKTETLKKDQIPKNITSLIKPGQDYYGVIGQSWYKVHNLSGVFEVFFPVDIEGYFHLLSTENFSASLPQAEAKSEQGEMVYFKQRFEMTSPFPEFFKYFHKEEHRSSVLSTLEDGCVEVALIQPGMDLDYLQNRGSDWNSAFLYIKLQPLESKPLMLNSAVQMLKSLSESLPTNVSENELLLIQNTGRVSQLEKLADLSDTAVADLVDESKDQIKKNIGSKSSEELTKKSEEYSQFPLPLSSLGDKKIAMTAEPELLSSIEKSRNKTHKKVV